jgi:hypothetical protein
LPAILLFPASLINSELIMGHDIKTIKEACLLMRRVWREASPFFFSIELWLVVLAAFALVGGLFLAVIGNAFCLLPIGFAVAYLLARPVLHVKGILAWPFI